MKTRKEKIAFVKGVLSGAVEPDDMAPRRCDIIALYPELKKQAYYFVNGKEVNPAEYQAARDRNKQLFGIAETNTDEKFGGLYLGTGSGRVVADPLPDYFDVKSETL